MNRKLLNKNDQIDVKEILDSLHENVGYSQEEAKWFCKATLLERFKKNFIPALDYLQKNIDIKNHILIHYTRHQVDGMQSCIQKKYLKILNLTQLLKFQ